MKDLRIIVVDVEESECTDPRGFLELHENETMSYKELSALFLEYKITASIYSITDFMGYYNDDEINSANTFIGYIKIKGE